jgi:hypothetical protein
LHEGKVADLSRQADRCIESADKQVLLGLSKMLGFSDQRYERHKYIRLAKEHYTTENIQMIFSMLPKEYSDTIDVFIKNDGLIREINRFGMNLEVDYDAAVALCSVGLCLKDTAHKFMPGNFRMPDEVMDIYEVGLLGKNKKTVNCIRSFISLMGIAEINFMHENLKREYNLKPDLSDFSKMVGVFAQLNHDCYISDQRLVITDILSEDVALYLDSRKKAKIAMDEEMGEVFFFSADIIDTYANTSTCASANLFELRDYLRDHAGYELPEFQLAEIVNEIRCAERLDIPELMNMFIHDGSTSTDDNVFNEEWIDIVAVTLLNALNDMRAYRDFSLKPDELPFQFLHSASEMQGILPEGMDIHLVQAPNSYRQGHYLSEMYGNKKIAKLKKVGRNDPCPCGSGKKYKKCCGAVDRLR